MDAGLESILHRVDETDISSIAARCLDVSSASLVGPLEMAEIIASHYDRKTIGIVRVSGLARTADNPVPRQWSAVVKITDLGVMPYEDSFTHVEHEATFYEQRLFADDGLSFRPARCFAILRPEPSLRLLWLEDLTGARGLPFDVGTLRTIMRHLGEWNGHHAAACTSLTFPLGRDSFAARWRSSGFADRVKEMPRYADTPQWRAAFGSFPYTIVAEYYDLLSQLVARSRSMPHSIAFGDLGAGNVFLKGDETVAIDWASLSMDPLGVDGGCLAGSPISSAGGAAIAASEPELFEAYLDGLRQGGWRGSSDEVRRPFMCHYGVYQLYNGLMPVFAGKAGIHFSREYIEKRFGSSLEDMPDVVAGVIQRIPGYIKEVRRLID